MSNDDKLEQLDDVAAYEAEEKSKKGKSGNGKDSYDKAEKEKFVRNQPVKQQAEKPARAERTEKKKKPGRFKRFFLSIGRKFKDTFLELRKVSWPWFGKVMKQTLVVLGVVLFFLVVIFIMDFGLGFAHKELMDAIKILPFIG